MAAENIKKVLKLVCGNGLIEDGDRLSEDILTFPINTVYINKDFSLTYIRVAENGVAADWVAYD